MGVLFVAPARPMAIGGGKTGLWRSLGDTTPADGGPPDAPLLSSIGGLSGWWDAGKLDNIQDPSGIPITVWSTSVGSLRDQSGVSGPMTPYSHAELAPVAYAAPRLSGLLGGVGRTLAAPNTLAPALDPDLGFQVQTVSLTSASAWTLYFVWSRPNWRQNSGRDADPIALIVSGATTILQADSAGGLNRLLLFPQGNPTIITDQLSRRHTHSIIIRYDPNIGVDVWLDTSRVLTAVASSLAANTTGPLVLLHDTAEAGGAQCWLHETAIWHQALSDSDIAVVTSYAERWYRGARRGLFFVFNGQSNAINYALNDGAAALLAQGVAWHLGALASNLLATTGSPNNYTMESGHGIYRVAAGNYPGSFLSDPGDGSEPSGWQLGADGDAVALAISQIPAEDRADVCALIWPWNETDSLRSYSEKSTFLAAATRFVALERGMLGQSATALPLIWWNAIPYGDNDGIQMHREVTATLATDDTQNVVIGNPQTTDSNPRGSAWDPTTGIAAGGDSGHRDSLDNQRFARLAAPLVSRAILKAGGGEAWATLPASVPLAGGPQIAHAYRQDDRTIVITIAHDVGTDLLVPLRAAEGIGFAVMDGGSIANPGTIVPAISCSRLDTTHLQIVLAAGLTNPSPACHLFYPYGNMQIGRGNVVTDNYASIPPLAGWAIGDDLGTAWAMDFPLQATSLPISLNDTP